MKRFMILASLAVLSAGWWASGADAQVVIQAGRPYVPVVVVPQVAPAYYLAPTPYSATYSASYSYYPSVVPQTVVTYSNPPYVTYSQPYVTYAAPAVVTTPSVIETRSYYGFGIFRPRGYYNEYRVYP